MADPILLGSHDGAASRPEHRRMWAWLENLAIEGDRVRRKEAEFGRFQSYLDLYYGKHWPDTMPSFKPAVVVNELRTLILSEASDLSESQLRIYVMKDPKKGGRDEQAERALRALWVDQEVDLKLLTEIVWALVLGTGFMRIQWNPDAAQGLGDVDVSDLDPRTVIPDPDAYSDKKMTYLMIETYMDLIDIRRMFPVTGMLVRPEVAYSSAERQNTGPEGTSWQVYSGPLTSNSSLLGQSIEGYKKARARVLDCMLKDDTTETVTEHKTDSNGAQVLDENGNVMLEMKVKAKYPNGRRIIGANGVILFDGDNPNPAGDFGVVRILLEPVLARFWGQGFIHQTAELQIAADKMMSAIVENAIRLNNGMVIATTNTGLDLENFMGIPGQVVTINQGSTLDIKYPPLMPPDMVQAPWRMLDMQRRILGFPEPRTGTGGRGNVSAELTETEISQAMGLTRLRSRMIYSAVRRLAEMMFARMASGYVTERVIPAVEGESFVPTVWNPLPRPELYRTYVDPASFQVMSRTMLKRLGLALFKLRGIDRDSLLETLGWPDWKKISDRMAKAEQASQMMEMWVKGNRK